MYYCLMKNVLNFFEFTFVTCKRYVNENALLNWYKYILSYHKKYIFITLSQDKSSKLGMPYFIFHTFPKRKILWVSIPVSVQLVLRHRPDHQVRPFCYAEPIPPFSSLLISPSPLQQSASPKIQIRTHKAFRNSSPRQALKSSNPYHTSSRMMKLAG